MFERDRRDVLSCCVQNVGQTAAVGASERGVRRGGGRQRAGLRRRLPHRLVPVRREGDAGRRQGQHRVRNHRHVSTVDDTGRRCRLSRHRGPLSSLCRQKLHRVSFKKK